MSQIAQMSEEEIEDRFRITGRTAIQFLLGQYADKGEPFTAVFNNGQDSFLTTFLAIWPDSGRLVVDRSGSPQTNARFLDSERIAFSGRPDGVRVQFVAVWPQEVRIAGEDALAVALPSSVIRLQRRESFRIETLRSRPALLAGRLPGGGVVEWPLHDLSVGGCGVNATMIPDSLVPGDRLSGARLVLPAPDGGELGLAATVRHVTETAGRAGLRQWRVGLAFQDLAPAAEIRIQRYIARVELERRERVG